MMEGLPVVVFDLGTERYGVPVEQVLAVEWVPPITPIPHTLPFIVGVVSLRGSILPVIDLRVRFGFPRSGDSQQMMVVRTGEVEVGLIVDAVQDVIPIDPDAVEPPPALAGGIEAAYLRGVLQTEHGVLVLLNLDRVLTDAEQRQVAEVQRRASGVS